MTPRAAVLTVSDRSWLALREDLSGPLIRGRLVALGYDVESPRFVPDDRRAVAAALREWSDARFALVLTTGGTGLAPRDQTPEATLDVAHRLVPGIVEWIRARTAATHPFAVLSRGVAVVRDSTLIINLPGSPRAVAEYLDLLEAVLPHALSQVTQRPTFGNSLPHIDERR
ncbi:MAG: MogA/MoaB family molybdenum cofactor biosynthesis protein [Candidatus Eisenbacteria bacterium]|nr:MogA/MoaB family molybdenum cofactor biosynthesis protein [Candidatus Eisenbacteria bacterium]MCC7143596.1 MogA/MoaB family molybdenum cofactor biosynthesis protein [Candidatus Eisenbacteria bacterium]